MLVLSSMIDPVGGSVASGLDTSTYCSGRNALTECIPGTGGVECGPGFDLGQLGQIGCTSGQITCVAVG
jgi:hypothetical protein